MKIRDILEAKPSKEYCKNTPAHKMSNSFLSSCKSQGYKARDSKVVTDIDGDGKQEKIGQRTLKGKKYGGRTPDWS